MRPRAGPLVVLGVLGAASCTPSQGAVDPEALIKRMSDRLASAKAFSFSTTEVHERRQGSGKREVRFSRTHLVRRPDGAAFTVTGGEREAAGTYDGRYFTLLWRSENAYARVRTPPTLDETLDRLAERYKIPMPVGDLVASSPYDRLMAPGVEGRYVSREPIGGRDCEHLAYTEPRVDWEIWIAASSDPTPCQLVITTKGQSGPLTSKVNFSNWNLSASVPDGAFEARIPEGYERILMVPREPAAAESPAPPAEDKKP